MPNFGSASPRAKTCRACDDDHHISASFAGGNDLTSYSIVLSLSSSIRSRQYHILHLPSASPHPTTLPIHLHLQPLGPLLTTYLPPTHHDGSSSFSSTAGAAERCNAVVSCGNMLRCRNVFCHVQYVW